MSEQSIYVLEKQANLIKIIVILHREGEIDVTKFMNVYGLNPSFVYRELGKANKLGLLNMRVDRVTYPPKTIYSLTEKGMRIGDHLMVVDMMLTDEKNSNQQIKGH